MNLTNSNIIPNSPTKTNIKSPKVITPYLHQLPYISKRITSSSPRTPRYKDEEVPNISRDQSREVSQTRNISEVVSRSGLHKALSPKKETLESLKSPRSYIPQTIKPQEANPIVSQVAKGDLMKVLPQMKLKTLRDKMLVLSKIHEKRGVEKDNTSSKLFEENVSNLRRDKNKSITPMELQDGKVRPDFLENLQDCLFTLKKNKLLEIEKPTDSVISFNKMAFVSPRGFNQRTRADHSISQSQIDVKSTFVLKTPGHQPTKSKDFAASTIKLKSELEISQEASLANVNNETIFKVHHTRGHSWGQGLSQLQLEERIPKGDRTTIQKPWGVMSARKHGRQYSCRNLVVRDQAKEEGYSQALFKSEKQKPSNNPLDNSNKLPSVTNVKLDKSTTSFNLRLDDSQKKDEGPAPSTESRKNALLSTECGSTTKRRKSFDKQKKISEEEDFDIFNIGHFIKGSNNKNSYQQNELLTANAETQMQFNTLKRSVYIGEDKSVTKKHNRRSSQGI